jgi:hypothetical protein
VEGKPDEEPQLRELAPVETASGSPAGRASFAVVCVVLVSVLVAGVILAVGAGQDASTGSAGGTVLTGGQLRPLVAITADGTLVEFDGSTFDERASIATSEQFGGDTPWFVVTSGNATLVGTSPTRSPDRGSCGRTWSDRAGVWRNVGAGVPVTASHAHRLLLAATCEEQRAASPSGITALDLETGGTAPVESPATTTTIGGVTSAWHAATDGFASLPQRCDRGRCDVRVVDPFEASERTTSIEMPPEVAGIAAIGSRTAVGIVERDRSDRCAATELVAVDAQGNQQRSEVPGLSEVNLAPDGRAALLVVTASCQPEPTATTATLATSAAPVTMMTVLWSLDDNVVVPLPSDLRRVAFASPRTGPTTDTTTAAGPQCSSSEAQVADQPGLPSGVDELRRDVLAALAACDRSALEALAGSTSADPKRVSLIGIDLLWRTEQERTLPVLDAIVMALDHQYFCPSQFNGTIVPQDACMWLGELPDGTDPGGQSAYVRILLRAGVGADIQPLTHADCAADVARFRSGDGATGPPWVNGGPYPPSDWPNC